ncbi:MAG TPA: chalcone isomerase family protein [Polyangiales bacterium]|nr:chalcone isomerase family protein [Polyangiales bacterium]
MTRRLDMLIAAALFVSAPLTAAAADNCAGVTLPAQSNAFGAELVRNGVGVREATFLNVDVYVAGLYVPHKTGSVNEILKQDEPKLIVLHFVRDVSREEMSDALNDALRKNVGDEFAAAHKHLQRFIEKLPPLRKGTQLSLAYRPGHGMELTVDGKALGTETDDHFANLVFRAWLGPRPPDQELKVGLLGGPCS